jgi:signal transduction histidine kinase
LTNILRHAHAGNIFVHLSQDDNCTTLVLSDDGDGFLADFHSSAQLPAEVFGLYSMFARAELIGAEIHVSSNPGKGTTVKVVCRHENEA